MARPGPKMIVEQLLRDARYDDHETYIVIYSTKGYRPPGDFYRNLRRLMELANIESPVRGVLICKGFKIANVAYELVKKYCRESMLFKVQKT